MSRDHKTGTREWATSSVNVQTGCSHGCLYCYAAALAVRFRRRAPGDWTREELHHDAATRRYGKRSGRVMFPTTHDITEANVEVCADAIERLLLAGNEVLVVSKPKLSVIERLCWRLRVWRPGHRTGIPAGEGMVTFRFTIGSQHNDVLRLWEPGAPSFADRFLALGFAYEYGWRTSVSIEPMLDSSVGDVVALVGIVSPLVTDTIWLGLMNHRTFRLKLNGHDPSSGALHDALMRMVGTPDQIRALYDELRGNPKARWKDSIKTMLGLPEEDVG